MAPETKELKLLLASPDIIHLVSTAMELVEDDHVGEVKAADHDYGWHLKAMVNRMNVSFHKYGSFGDVFPDKAVGIEQVHQRLAKYLVDGNTEWLIDAANYCIIEALRPSNPKAHFKATTAEESPGRINTDGSVTLKGAHSDG